MSAAFEALDSARGRGAADASTGAEPVMALHAVHKTYQLGQLVVHALRGVDLTVRRGELLALTGPSGSGKSRILNLAGLIDVADRGAVQFGGCDVTGLDEAARTLLRREPAPHSRARIRGPTPRRTG